MKTKYIIIIICAALIIGVVIFLGVTDKLPFLQSKEKKHIREELTSTVWLGGTIIETGAERHVTEVFGSDISISFMKNGSCNIEMRDEIINAKWKLNGDKISIRGGKINAEADYDVNYLSGTLDYFILYPLEGYYVQFDSKAYYDRLSEEVDNINKEREMLLEEWKNSLDADLSTCKQEFTDLLHRYHFQKFEPLLINEENKEKLIEEYFTPILSLGLQYNSWSWLYQGDEERLLDGYEIYEFNLKLDEAERSERDGELVLVPYDEVANYIGLRLPIDVGQEPILDPLEEMLTKSRRYFWESHSFEMKISKELDEYFEADLVEAWALDEKVVIHMLYGDGERDEDHAWFLLEKNSSCDCYNYIGGSAFEP